MRENTDQNNSEYVHFLRSENNKLSMGQFKKYVTCIKVLFIVLSYITLSPISLNITFFVCMAASVYHIISKEIEKRIMDTIVFVSNPYWQSSGVIIFLCKCYIVILDTLIGSWMCFTGCLLNIIRVL